MASFQWCDFVPVDVKAFDYSPAIPAAFFLNS